MTGIASAVKRRVPIAVCFIYDQRASLQNVLYTIDVTSLCSG